MPLQVRVVHALGDQVVELPDRSHEAALVVGRLEGVDLQVPSAAVSRGHCILYVQDGQWVVQDTQSSAGTFVNGHRVTGPSAIGSGDRVTLGNDPASPALTIDPYGMLAATGAALHPAPPPAIAATPRPSPATAKPQQTARPPTPTASAIPGAAPRVAAAMQSLPQPGAVAPPSASAGEDWLTSAAAQRARTMPYYIPKRTAWTPGVLTATILCTIVILGVGGYLYQQRAAKYQASLPVVTKRPPAPPPPRVEEDDEARAKRVAPLPKRGPTAEEERAKRMATRGGDDAWNAVEEAHNGRTDPIASINVYLAYLRDNPKTPYAADVAKFMEDDLDRVWWNHVDELLKDRRKLTMQVSEKNQELLTTTDPDFKAQVEKEKADINADIAVIDTKLKEMNYESKESPNLDNPDMMNTLRNARDSEYYDRWKLRAIERIKFSHGRESVW